MWVTVTGWYDAPLDPEVYEGTTDPQKMAAIDESNDLEGLLSLCSDVTWRVTPGDATRPTVGQVWYDRDHRVSSRYACVIAVLDDGRVQIARGRDGTGQKSKISAKNLTRRFDLLPQRGDA